MTTRATLTLFYAWLGCFALNGQVYFSQINDSIFVGPENVENVTLNYIKTEIQSIDRHLNLYEEPKISLLAQIEKFNQKEVLSKAQKHLLKKLLLKEQMVLNEFGILEEIKNLWMTILLQGSSKLATEDSMHCRLKIPFQRSLEHVEWVKKRDNNCHSSNPEDCLVWCREIKPETIQCHDTYHQIYKVQGCPDGWIKEKEHCYLELYID